MLPRSDSFEVVPSEGAPSSSTEAAPQQPPTIVEDAGEETPAIEESAAESSPDARNKSAQKLQPSTKDAKVVSGGSGDEGEEPNVVIYNRGEERIRSGRRRSRRPSYSPVRYYSPAPVRIYSRSPSPNRRSNLEEVSSHVDLIPVAQKKTDESKAASNDNTTTTTTWKDRAVRLQPFNRKAYVTTHAATVVDFRTWLPILAFAMPDHWYTYPNLKTLAPFLDIPTGLSAAAAHIALPPLTDSRPIALTVPMVSASAALTTKLEGDDDDEEDGEEESPLLYLSVQQAASGGGDVNDYMYDRGVRRQIPDVVKEGPVIGTPIYRVVKTGSRDAAASLAFYSAGASRWSTVFTCVVAANHIDGDLGLSPAASAYSRAKSLKDLVASRSKGKIKIFY